MILTCPKCGKPFETANLNIAQDIAFCAPCGEIHKISNLVTKTSVEEAAGQVCEPAQPTEAEAPAAVQTAAPLPEAPVLQAKTEFCMECGTPLSEGVKFCVGCGKPAGAIAAPPEAAVQQTKSVFCMECGAQIKEGLKFCTGCGTPVK